MRVSCHTFADDCKVVDAAERFVLKVCSFHVNRLKFLAVLLVEDSKRDEIGKAEIYVRKRKDVSFLKEAYTPQDNLFGLLEVPSWCL